MRKLLATSRWNSSQPLQLWFFLGALALLLWTFIVFDVRRTREQALTGSARELGNLALVFSKEIESSVRTIDISLLELRERWARDAGEFPAVVKRRNFYLDQEAIFQISVIDSQGMLIYSSLDAVPKVPMDLSDRDHFRIHRERGSDALFISKPVQGRVSGRWSVQFTRPILDQQGKFAGVMVLSVSPEYFQHSAVYQNLPAGSTILLMRGTGEVLARLPNPEWALGMTIQDSPALRPDAAHAGTFTKAAQIDGVERLFAWRRLTGQDLVITMGYPMQVVLQPYRQQRSRAALAGLGLTLLLALVGYLKRRDMRQREAAARALTESEARLSAALSGAGDGVWDWDITRGEVIFSRGWKAMLGFEEHEIGNDLQEWRRRVHPEDLPRVLQDLQDYLGGSSGAFISEHRALCKDGSWRWILDRGMAITRDEHGTPLRMVGTHTDITAHKEMEERLRTLATTDGLTGLLNRREFLARMENELARLRRDPAARDCVLMADLDHFKKINDRYGHAAGDQALRHFSALLRAELRQTDFAGRLGGEEFAVVLAGSDVEGAGCLAQRLCLTVAQTPFLWGEHVLSLTVSMGLAAIQSADNGAEQALQRADEGLYRAKQGGRNRCIVAGSEFVVGPSPLEGTLNEECGAGDRMAVMS